MFIDCLSRVEKESKGYWTLDMIPPWLENILKFQGGLRIYRRFIPPFDMFKIRTCIHNIKLNLGNLIDIQVQTYIQLIINA